MRLFLRQILSAAEEGGLGIKQSNAIELKIVNMIGRTEGTLCGCTGCDNALAVDDICYCVIQRIVEILLEFRDFHDVDDVT